ncbi:hypothetical protein [Kitasatospora aureofaciens]|nr:hypothetical protein [Kitasatospora aureofaciens]
MPDDDEQQRRLLLQLAASNAQLAPAALEALGVSLPDSARAAATDADRAPVEIAREPVEPELPRNDPPQLVASAAGEWRVSCLDMAVRRALERAGQWLLNRGGRSLRGQFRHVPLHRIHVELAADPEQLDPMLTDAYREFHAATPGETCLHRAVDHYVRALLLAREEHHRDYLTRAIAQAGCDEEAA